jgi:hypothetical protein
VYLQVALRCILAHTVNLGNDPTHLGAEIGFTSILHTWGQTLSFHPHVHCIVTGGGINNGEWIKEKWTKRNFLFPRRAMEKVFKGFFMERLRRMYRNKQFQMDQSSFDKLIKTIGYKKWNVYAKKPFGGPQQVVEYLGRYTHKVAISHHRIVSLNQRKVIFRYKDYHDGGKSKMMALSTEEFARRFEQHILPKGFVKIRSYGFMKHYNKSARLAAIRKRMNLPPAPPKVIIPVRQRMLEKYGKDIAKCPRCEKGTMILKETLRPVYKPQAFINQLTGPHNHSP